MTASAIADRYGLQIGELPGGSEFAASRRAALDRFQELGLPHRRIETWHYTDLSGLSARDFDFLGKSPDPASVDAASAALTELDLDATAPCCVFVDGHMIEELSSYTGFGGLHIDTLTAAPEKLLDPTAASESALEALNTAFVRSGLMIGVSQVLAQPLQLVYFGTGAGLASQQRLRIELARDAGAAVVQYLAGLGASGEEWLNQVIEIDQARGSELSLYRLQHLSAASFQTTLTRATLAEHARLNTCSVELGGALTRHEILVALHGDASSADLAGLTLTRTRQHSDTRVAVRHAAPHTTSRQQFRAIADDSSRSVFNGKVTVHEHAQHIDAKQKSDNLLLSPSAEIDTKPELEIYADQVACSHGATVGELSEDELFYLRSRGIDAESARSILTTAFAEVILEQFPDPRFREHARSAVHRLLPGRAHERQENR